MTDSPASPVRVAVFGASGRLGHLICQEAAQRGLSDGTGDATLVAAITHAKSTHLGRPAAEVRWTSTDTGAAGSDQANADAKVPIPRIAPDLPSELQVDVIVDASTDEGTRRAIATARDRRAALLIATTGLSDATRAVLDGAAALIPILIAPNTSLGIAVARRLVHRAARLLGSSYDSAIIEAHHRYKKDAPSGTAFVLRDALQEGGQTIADDAIISMRGGDVVGEHTVRFAGPGEFIEIRHVATSRALFARGAIDAACWLVRQTPGRYTIDDLLAMRLTARDEQAS